MARWGDERHLEEENGDPPPPEIDLHTLAPTAALRRLAQELHACRLRGSGEVLVITGRGWGNREQLPILRGKVETWLRGEPGQRAGVLGFEQRARGGALLVRLRVSERREPS